MRTFIGEPFFLASNGCPTTKRTEFIGIISSPSKSPEFHGVLSQFILKDVDPICKGNVSPGYVEGSIEDCELLACVLYLSPEAQLPITPQLLREDESIVQLYGFASCLDSRLTSNGEDNSLYIDVICGNPIGMVGKLKFPPPGKTLLNLVTEYARNNDYMYVSLSALLNVINYYRKLGFRHLKAGSIMENPYITYLANLNKDLKLSDSDQAVDLIKIERAFKLSQELGSRNKPKLNEAEFARQLRDTLDLEEKPDSDGILDYLAEMDPRIIESNGSEGYYDLVAELVRSGFSAEDECSNVSQRLLVSPDEEGEVVVNCSSSGMTMRKPLFADTEEPGLSAPIIQCSMSGGRKKRRQTKRKIKIKRFTRKNIKTTNRR